MDRKKFCNVDFKHTAEMFYNIFIYKAFVFSLNPVIVTEAKLLLLQNSAIMNLPSLSFHFTQNIYWQNNSFFTPLTHHSEQS